MTEILSQDEIDALLSAISTGEVEMEDYSNVGEQKKVKIYDFRRPDKFSKDQIRTLQMMHETFARLTTTALSAQLRALVGVHVGSVDQLTYEEFIRSIPNPTTLAVINMDPLKGSAVLEIDPGITFTIIDRLFGGPGEPTKITRELSDIEMSVMESIIVRILGNLREAWATVIDLRPRLGNIETNPQFAQIVPPNDMVVLITLETKVGDVEGMTNLCIPYITIEPIISKLSAQYWYSSIRRGESDENRAIIQERLDMVDIPLRCEVGEVDLPMADVINVREGDVVRLGGTHIKSDMMIRVGDRKKFKCRPGRIGNRLCVQIGDAIEDVPDELLGSSRSEDEV
ncbi:MAG: flagellar motor switch protein FliM [Leptospirales bacterium]|jgi:flagellar motor switch protein FliM|nr:flagellar motor switch protein FliM [Leptospirales bacterium]HMW60840.1 flagellar motor switch protein FliM [Leptospiraceae bacterium]HMZ37558.1 flagellar motor switch protein FliM [Leptospiraceae bacterium]HNE23702.1 flagellar motor switch protein FliM [Leptospiraceae bacterium]HNL01600.1 flagellar motor switch protein FliM [Leptospiraceae bacterium]